MGKQTWVHGDDSRALAFTGGWEHDTAGSPFRIYRTGTVRDLLEAGFNEGSIWVLPTSDFDKHYHSGSPRLIAGGYITHDHFKAFARHPKVSYAY